MITIFTVFAGVVLASPTAAGNALVFAVESLVLITPIMIAGLIMTPMMTASNSMQLIASAFKGREIKMIILASLVGAVTPVCGATVLPLVAGLLVARVPIASIMAFWLSSPVTDPAMMSLTVATLGWSFAIAKTLGAILVGVFGGMTSLILTQSGLLKSPIKNSGYINSILESACGGGEKPVLWRFWKEQERVKNFQTTFMSTGKLMLTWLALAFVAEYYLNQFVPLDWLTSVFGEDSVWAVPMAAIIGAPIYLDGYAALPLVRSLMDSGMRPDAALTFLVAGGITSAWAAIPVYALVRNSVFALYLVLAVSSSILVGWTAGHLL
jgi:uncharacterized membrane protein YraQ (UPF0718 family)